MPITTFNSSSKGVSLLHDTDGVERMITSVCFQVVAEAVDKEGGRGETAVRGSETPAGAN